MEDLVRCLQSSSRRTALVRWRARDAAADGLLKELEPADPPHSPPRTQYRRCYSRRPGGSLFFTVSVLTAVSARMVVSTRTMVVSSTCLVVT